MTITFKNVHFYSHYGNGDIFISREFVREMSKKIIADNYYYAHAKPPRIIADLDWIKHEKITDNHKMRSYCEIIGEDLYINTWLGVTSRYVTDANSCNIKNSLRMYNDSLLNLRLGIYLNQPLENYIPCPDYDYFQIENVNKFVRDHRNFILIDTCNVQSNQAENFDFISVINSLYKEFPNELFITTTPFYNLPNVLYTGDITKTNDGFDLNEIGYLSLWAKLIVGRSSGPQVFCTTKYNVDDHNKTFLTFAYKKSAMDIVGEEIITNANRFWSSEQIPDNVATSISMFIQRQYYTNLWKGNINE